MKSTWNSTPRFPEPPLSDLPREGPCTRDPSQGSSVGTGTGGDGGVQLDLRMCALVWFLLDVSQCAPTKLDRVFA